MKVDGFLEYINEIKTMKNSIAEALNANSKQVHIGIGKLREASEDIAKTVTQLNDVTQDIGKQVNKFSL